MDYGANKMWLLIVWQLSFTEPMLKTMLETEEQCRYTGAQFEVMYRETSRPVEFTCKKMGE